MSNVPEIESRVLSLEDIYRNYFYIVPNFQREYVWKSDDVDTLLQDIFNEFTNDNGDFNEKYSEYFIGSIVVYPEDKNERTYKVVDGQQRLTTCYLVFCGIRDILRKEGNGEIPSLNEMIISNHLSSDGKTLHLQRLILQYEESQGILEDIACNNQIEKQKNTGSVKNILEAYNTIKSFIIAHEFLNNNPEKIRKFLAAFSQRVKLIQIITGNTSHALKIFETINHRGIDLEAMDLLKNLLFREANLEKYDTIKVEWKKLTKILEDCDEKPMRFLRYFILSHYKDTPKTLHEEDVYDWFVKNKQECGIKDKPIEFVKELIKQGTIYKNFVNNKDVNGVENPYLYNIHCFGHTIRQHFILLMAGQHLSPDLFNKLCINIENLLFCSVITHVKANVFESEFSQWANDLREAKDVYDLEKFLNNNFKANIEKRKSNFDLVFGEMTETSVQKYRLKYIIAKLTQFVDENCGVKSGLKEYLKNSRIEYILPKTEIPSVRNSFDKISEYEVYQEKLGNLILLEENINISASNALFETKKQAYLNSSYMLNKCLVEFPTIPNKITNPEVMNILHTQFNVWDSDDIKKRQVLLGRLANEIWLPILRNKDVPTQKPKMTCPDCHDVSLGYLRIENSQPILKCNCGKPLEINCDRFVFDTNIWVSRLFSNLANTPFFENKTILSSETVRDEINNWKNKIEKKEEYKNAMEENKCVREWRDKKRLELRKIGKDASYSELIKKGNPDKIIARDAIKNNAIILTCDKDYLMDPDVTVLIYKQSHKIETKVTENKGLSEYYGYKSPDNNVVNEKDIFDIKITEENQGAGVGHYKNHTIFISSAGNRIGDIVKVQIYTVFKDKLHAKAKILTPKIKY